MTVKLIKQMIDACRLGKRACDMMPPLQKDVLPSYIHVLDTVHTLEAAGGPVRVSDISDALGLPRPGVTRTVKEMEAKGYLTKSASPDDGRVTYITATEAGRQLWDKYDTQYFPELLPALQDIPEEDAACMLVSNKSDFTQGNILHKLTLFTGSWRSRHSCNKNTT